MQTVLVFLCFVVPSPRDKSGGLQEDFVLFGLFLTPRSSGDNGQARMTVLDEVTRAFSPWVQRLQLGVERNCSNL